MGHLRQVPHVLIEDPLKVGDGVITSVTNMTTRMFTPGYPQGGLPGGEGDVAAAGGKSSCQASPFSYGKFDQPRLSVQ